MTENFEFTINDETLSQMISLKNQLGFENKNWDEWFQYLLRQENSRSPRNEIEQVMKKIQYESFNEWVTNFAINLNDIWNESSAAELNQNHNNESKMKSSAIVIGRGPSVKKHKHLELLSESNFNGSIICTDGSLVNALKAGITPEKFPNYYVVTIDPYSETKKFYDDPLVDKYGKKIRAVFTTIANPVTVQQARQSGMKIFWLHSLFDYNEGEKSFNQISALMVRAKKHSNGLPAIQTGGNVGTASWFVGWKILKCPTVVLIGINHGWEEDDPWELIVSHGKPDLAIEMDKASPEIKKLFPKIYNPYFNCYCILDPLFQFYSSALKEFIARSPDWLSTINATEGGCIFGEKIKCMTLSGFLQDYSH